MKHAKASLSTWLGFSGILLVLFVSLPPFLLAQQTCDKSAVHLCLNQPHEGDTNISCFLTYATALQIKINGTLVATNAVKGKKFSFTVEKLSQYDTVEVSQSGPGGVSSSSGVVTVAAAAASQTDFDLVLGVGSLIAGPNVNDYKVNAQNSLLETTNLGRATPQLLTGAAFRLPFGIWSEGARRRFGPNPWYAFLSLKFSPQSSQTFSGYVLGGSFKLAKAFSVLAGYALTPIQEPSPGFRTAAAQVVQQNSTLPFYQRFDPNALLQNRPEAFDGFPLFVQNANGPTSTRVFAGDPTVVHYHGGLVIGVAIPISVKTALGGGGESKK
jgi:hypothetical protein